MLKKLLTIGILFLFVGLAFSPSLTADIPEHKTVEIIVEVCRENNVEEHTIILTQQDYNEAKLLFDSINESLDSIESMDEAIVIYTDAIIELKKYGMLPNALSVDDAINLITDGLKYDAGYFNNYVSPNNINEYLCLVFGYGTDSKYFPAFYGIPFLIVLLFGYGIIGELLYRLYLLFPISLYNIIGFGWFLMYTEPKGIIKTFNLKGMQEEKRYLDGVIFGFTGLKYAIDLLDDWALIGTATYVNIDGEGIPD
jgi:hypothetical protein